MKNPANSGPFSTVFAKRQNSGLGGGGCSLAKPVSLLFAEYQRDSWKKHRASGQKSKKRLQDSHFFHFG
jgi:hypothetical protein